MMQLGQPMAFCSAKRRPIMKELRTRTKRCFRSHTTLVVTLIAVLGIFSSYPGSAEGEMRSKQASSRKDNDKLACEDARESALKLAKLDCMTGAGVLDKAKFSKCECNPMGGKSLCAVTVTYKCD